MPDALEELLDSLLYEGYALYPYTPAATKNATPTPFGIVYPPAYAAAYSSTFDHLELRCLLKAPADARLSAELRFLQPSGERHEGAARSLRLPDVSLRTLADGASGAPSGGREPSAAPGELEVEVGDRSGDSLRVALRLGARDRGEGTWEVCFAVENRTPCAPGLDRAGALRHSLISAHPLMRASQGRFVSPLEHPCCSVNTFPVLASAEDDVVLGAAIVLPDHPQLAPESRGSMFDSTEIEEALLLHVHALSDSERAEIEQSGDPTVRAMIARAGAATPADVLALHGRVTLRDPVARDRLTLSPPQEPAGLADPRAGEEEAEVDGVKFRRGGTVRICPGPDADLHARMLEGRTATIERILIDYDGKMHLGVTIDGDPGQELMRESGRYLFFFAPEVEVLSGAGEERTGR